MYNKLLLKIVENLIRKNEINPVFYTKWNNNIPSLHTIKLFKIERTTLVKHNLKAN